MVFIFLPPPLFLREKTGKIVCGPPKFCMCWFMELDDSKMAKWALSGGEGEKGKVILDRIDEWIGKE